MRSFKVVVFLVLTLNMASVTADEKASDFFNNYMALGEAFDPSVADLYDDNAKIEAYRVYPHGLERNMELSGAQWKQLLIKVMPIAKSVNDKSTYTNIKINKHENGYKIKADRYSVRKCYTDAGYYMIIKKNTKNKWAIFKEYMETKPLPNC